MENGSWTIDGLKSDTTFGKQWKKSHEFRQSVDSVFSQSFPRAETRQFWQHRANGISL